MRSWYHLVRETVDAEFPSHELMSAFECFDVSSRRVRADSPIDSLKRIAKAYTIDEPRLCAQFEDVEPRERHAAQSTGCSSADAWANVVARLQSSPKTRQAHPIDAIGAAVAEMCVYSRAVTSSVEQSFSRSAWSFGCRSWHSLPFMEEACHRVGFALAEKVVSLSEVAVLAQRFWHEAFGSSRATSCTARIDTGVKRRRALLDDENFERTEAAFLRKRRQCVQAGADETIPTLADTTEGHSGVLINTREHLTYRSAQVP